MVEAPHQDEESLSILLEGLPKELRSTQSPRHTGASIILIGFSSIFYYKYIVEELRGVIR